MIYKHETDKKIISITYGSFAREQNCLILLYEKDGFEVLITHRLFNPKEKYNPKILPKLEKAAPEKELAIPKKTSQFLKYWKS